MRKSSYNNEKEISKEECNIQTENNEQLINNNQRYMEEYIEEEVKADYIYAESFIEGGLGQAIMNRLMKAAGHHVLTV